VAAGAGDRGLCHGTGTFLSQHRQALSTASARSYAQRMSGEPAAGTTGASGDSGQVGSGQDINIGQTQSGPNVITGGTFSGNVVTAETVALMATAIYSKAYLEALGRRTEQGVANLSKRVGDLVRARAKRKGRPDEYLIGLGDGKTAMIVVTEDTPDEARLALLDLDVTAPELRGKCLSWSEGAGAWLAIGEPPAKLDEATATD